MLSTLLIWLKSLTSTGWISLGSVIFAIIILSYFGLSNHSLKQENQLLTEKVTRYQAEIEYSKTALILAEQSLKDNVTALIKLEQNVIEEARRNDLIQKELERIYEENPEACTWSTDRLPDAVYNFLCQRDPLPAAGS